MIDTLLLPKKTVNAKGDGPSIDVNAASNRVLLLTLAITNIVEQESLDVSIQGSADGVTFDPKPIVAFPQKFYRGEHPLLLDLRDHAAVKAIRAHWDVGRWGRGSETPMFEFQVAIKEVPQDVLREATAQAQALV